MAEQKPRHPARGSGEALHHVFYEIEMLVACHNALSAKNWSGPSLEHNCYLESFLIHARNLDEFFFDQSDSGGLMKPWHFGMPRVESKKARHPDIGRFNAEVCHLGYNRKTTPNEGGWAISLCFEPLALPCLRFLEFVIANDKLMAHGNNRKAAQYLVQAIRALPLLSVPRT